ncbi:MAG: cytochrome c maturation protein CcmE [Ignavibacteriae bacterium]|nr:cytochrome c maturation protein CcmE [Ignavibacteriota bacterium]
MTGKIKIIIASVVVVVFIVVGFMSFMDNKIDYASFADAQKRLKTVEVKGVWQKDKETKYDAEKSTFTFYMKDEANTEMKVILDGAKPNNFDIATMIVAKGKVKDDVFYAKEILTKCPSKYEGKGEDVKKSSNL